MYEHISTYVTDPVGTVLLRKVSECWVSSIRRFNCIRNAYVCCTSVPEPLIRLTLHMYSSKHLNVLQDGHRYVGVSVDSLFLLQELRQGADS